MKHEEAGLAEDAKLSVASFSSSTIVSRTFNILRFTTVITLGGATSVTNRLALTLSMIKIQQSRIKAIGALKKSSENHIKNTVNTRHWIKRLEMLMPTVRKSNGGFIKQRIECLRVNLIQINAFVFHIDCLVDRARVVVRL
ncbi:hypothetical protein J5N97_008735 [Dioscorea zingiberensis]|uniref:Uncharacterized protein n=1 Tax=Dioscorea zingiberensis TaxID=325984 RepID=A0A9D5CV63_9LILI|nr:hypothetical protein J5N97_008735 [Dioscorea zingiberensis]